MSEETTIEIENQEASNSQDNTADNKLVNGSEGFTTEMIDAPQAFATVWQRALYTTGLIVVIGIFSTFIWATLLQTEKIHQSIDNSPILQDSLIYNLYIDASKDNKNDALSASMILLENQNINKRYHTANSILKSHVYIKFLGFLTGMILSVLGAIFVLGKFREYPTKIRTKSEMNKGIGLQLQSSSPGIILAILGTILMISTILVQKEGGVKDGSVYIQMNVPASKMNLEENDDSQDTKDDKDKHEELGDFEKRLLEEGNDKYNN